MPSQSAHITEQPDISQKPILFYDGECGFCNNSIMFVLRHEHNTTLMFAPLQGKTAAEVLRHSGLPEDIGKHTIVIADNGRFLTRSRAALRTMKAMGGPWAVLATIGRIVPTSLADAAYNLVARNRGRLPSGKSCQRIPPDQTNRFLS